MNGWFDEDGFNSYYLQKSKYEKKQALLNAFYPAWYHAYGTPFYKMSTFTTRIHEVWKPDLKKAIKVSLISQGFTSASVDGLFRLFTEWNKYAPK